MGKVENILAGAPVQIAIYDSVNGALFLGYVADSNVDVTQKPLSNMVIDGLSYQYGTRTTIKIRLLESDPSKLAALVARRNTKQDVYITAWNYGLKISNIYLTVAQRRSYKFGDTDYLELVGTTDVEGDVSLLKNLLGADGGFEVDTNTDGVSDGWTKNASDTASRNTPSFLSSGGGSYDQQVDYGAADRVFYHTLTWYFDQPIRLRARVYARATGFAEDMRLNIRTLDVTDTEINIYYGTTTNIPITGQTALTNNSLILATSPVKTIQVRLRKKTNSGGLRFDNCQLMITEQSTYTENT